MSYRVVFTDHTFDDLDLERAVLAEVDAEVIDGGAADVPIEELVADADALLVTFADIDAAVIEAMPGCRVVSRTGIGVDNVDIDAATARGIYVTNVPDYCIPEVSDHAMALLLALSRKVVEYDAQVAGGGWDVSAGRPMRRLETQTLGLVAFGNIARAVCGKAQAFGLDVLAYDPYLEADEIRAGGAEPADDLDDLLTRADVVSVHAPLTPETEGLIDADALAKMKDTAFLINVARGGIVDEAALARAIEAGTIAGAGLDVLVSEPPDPDNPLLTDGRVVVTPHAAWNSAESVRELREKAARNVRDALAGEVPPHLVNRDLVD